MFVAVPLPDVVRAFVDAAQSLIPQRGGIRFLSPEQLHLTLAFIGDADEAKTAAARMVLESLSVQRGGRVALDGLMLLPSPRKTRVVAIAVDDPLGVLAGLVEPVMGGLEAAGVMKREKRPFRGHVTIARVKNPGWVQPTSQCGRVEFAIESVCLYESELRREGAKYSVLAQATLKRTEEGETA